MLQPAPPAEIADRPDLVRPERRVMVVDDSRVQRKILSTQLSRAGFLVTEAGTGAEALEICRRHPHELVISDWMMPGLSGLEFCRALREIDSDRYVYFILLTSKSESAEIARGLDGGADDFLTKPVNGDELRARIDAGERILRMERELLEKNRLLSSTLSELQRLYDSVDRDLQEARKLQQSLVRERNRNFGGAEVSLLLRPSGHVGGDLVGYFPINATRIGVFSIDVSGHGITSALMTARIAGYLSGDSPEQNLALVQTHSGSYDARAPEELAKMLNQMILREMQTETYLTLAYAELDLATGDVALVQAGHPHPAVQRANGAVEFLGAGGMPIGLIEAATYERVETRLAPGDRLLLMSDGVTEAENASGAQLGEDGLAILMDRCGGSAGPDYLETLIWHLSEFSAGEFLDDVSAALVEFQGVPGGRA
ncbi:MAG: SpoIIE family protein phosphatase [Rhodobacteraceae bacterium]|nr:SpoIIE family protein phosphatase [Paracoccaceae bacterium]